METYANYGGRSAILQYDIGDDHIEVVFKGRMAYLYTLRSVGAANLATMKRLAAAGSGLATFITHNVKDAYESKRRV